MILELWFIVMFVPMVNIIARSTVQKFTACLSRDFGARKTEDFGSTGEKYQGYVKRRAATVVHFAEILEVVSHATQNSSRADEL